MKNTVHLGPAGLAKSKQAGARNGMSGATIPGLPNHPASRKPSPGLEPEPSGPHPSRCPRPGGRGRGWGGSPTSWATRLEMRTARLTRPFWALGCRAPVLLAFPAGAAMEDLAPPSLPARGPRAQPAPHLHLNGSLSPGCAPAAGGLAPRAASGTKPGSLGLGSPWQ